MHYLVDRLRSFGIEAYVYPWVDEKAHREAMEADEEGFSATTATLLEHYALNPEFNTSVRGVLLPQGIESQILAGYLRINTVIFLK